MSEIRPSFAGALEALNPDCVNAIELYRLHWLTAELFLFQWARAKKCVLNNDEVASLVAVVNRLSKSEGRDNLRSFLMEQGVAPPNNRYADQLIHTTLGVLNGVLAAHCLSQWNSGPKEPLAPVLSKCIGHYHAAWDLYSTRIAEFPDHEGSAAHSDRSTRYLSRCAQSLPESQRGTWSESNWLLVRRLLSYLVGDNDSPIQGESNDVQMMLGPSSGYRPRGVYTPLSVTAHVEGFASAYLDPIALGVTILDSEMLNGLRIATRICRSLLQKRRTQGTAVRIGPHPGRKALLVLEGDAAGGMVTVAACATAQELRLNRDCSATFFIRMNDITLLRHLYHPLSMDEVQVENTYSPWLCLCSLYSDVCNCPTDPLPTPESGFPLDIRRIDSDMRLADVIRDMTGDERIERLIRKHADKTKKEWEDMLAGTSICPDNYMIEANIEPWLSVELRPEEIRELRQQESERNGDGEDARLSESGEFELLQDPLWDPLRHSLRWFYNGSYLRNESNWILVTERAGGGRTVLSWQLRNLLSSTDRPFFVVRYENLWPANLRQSLIDEVQFYNPEQKAEDIVDWLIEYKRIVVIFDALDEVSLEAVESLMSLRRDPDEAAFRAQSIRLIVTCRPNEVERWPGQFDRNDWRHVRLETFDGHQLRTYLDKFADLRERKTSGEGHRIREIWEEIVDHDVMSLPNNLREIRLMIEEHLDEGTPLRAFRTRGDLRWEIAYRNLSRDPLKGQEKHREAGVVAELIRAASCLAVEMLRQSETFFVLGEEAIQEVKEQAGRRFGLNWHMHDQMLQQSILAGDAVLRRNNTSELSFHSQRSLEFFAGLYLAKYVDDNAIRKLMPFIGLEKWHEAWTFAIDMPLTTTREGQPLHDNDALERSLTALFSPPADGPRPTDLMCLACDVMTQTNFSRRSNILGAYRQQFLDILAGKAEIPPLELSAGAEKPTKQNRARRAAELITQEDFDTYTSGLEPDWVNTIRPDYKKFPTYALCSNGTSQSPLARPSNDTENLTFLMGASPDDISASRHEKYDATDKEKWWVEKTIPAFQMATCCVTRAQFRLFDAHREQQELNGEFGKNRSAPDEDCPITDVNWWDAFCLAIWIGEKYQLPNEMQWEGAAWGGIDRAAHRDAVVSVPPYHACFTSNEVNHNEVNHYWMRPITGQLPSDFALRTLPVRWDESRCKEPLMAPVPEPLPRNYRSNGFGLWQVNGNVLEWCVPGRNQALKDVIDVIEQHKADLAGTGVYSGVTRVGFLRYVVRGGSWVRDAKFARTSERSWCSADGGYYQTGFRLSRTRST